MKTNYWEQRRSMTPQQVIQLLRDGNTRFVNNLRVNRNHLDIINETAQQQAPFVTMLSCSDSRLCPEMIFDLGLGDVFSIKLAGNIASPNAIGSMEYACKILGSKLLVVMGHTNCGAIKGACDNLQMDNLNVILDHIRPFVEEEQETNINRTSQNPEFVNRVSHINVRRNIDIILHGSPIIRKLLHDGEISIIGAMYHVETGHAEFLNLDNDKNILHENVLYQHA